MRWWEYEGEKQNQKQLVVVAGATKKVGGEEAEWVEGRLPPLPILPPYLDVSIRNLFPLPRAVPRSAFMRHTVTTDHETSFFSMYCS